MSRARESILSKLRGGLAAHQLPKPFPETAPFASGEVFVRRAFSPEETFADAFTALGGRFVFCENEHDLMENLHALHDSSGYTQMLCAEPKLLSLFSRNKLDFIRDAGVPVESADACITGCEFLVGRTGSIILSSKTGGGRISSVYYPVHIVVAYPHQVVADIPDALVSVLKKYEGRLPSMINLNTGPSRTADIEKTLVVGVHGPGEVYCFFVNAP